MPELAEVEISRQKLLPLVRGRRMLDFWTDWPRGFRVADSVKRIADSMRGRKTLDVARRGKVLFFKLSGKPERMLAIHLRMSGRLEVAHSSASAKRERLRMRHPEPRVRSGRGIPPQEQVAETWVHFRWRLSGNRELRFIDPRKFGLVWYGSPEELARDPYLGRLGADVRSLTPQRFLVVLSSGAGMVKPFLLRQDKFSGIGNIIADESLWRAGIHPETRIANLDARTVNALHRSIQHTIRAMLASGGTSIRTWRHPDGAAGRFQERRLVYGKAGKPCRRCKAKLIRIVVGGRGTTICPQCQRE